MKRILKIIALCALVALVALSLFACAGTPQDPDDGKGEEASAIRMIPKMNIDMIDGKIEIPYELTEGDGPVSWSSESSSIAAVTQQGELYPIAKGTTTIVAKAGQSRAECEVTVTDLYASYTKLSTAEDIENLAASKNYTKKSKKYYLANDIDFDGKTIQPLGGWSDPDNVFNATFDGRGFALKNFKIEKPESCKTVNAETGAEEYFGVSLFPCVGGKICNLNLIGVDFSGFGFTGGIAGELKSGASISNCFVQGKINATGGFDSSVPAGGVCGIMGKSAKVTDVYIDADILGGFVFAGFNFGDGSHCAARKNSISAFVRGEELMFQTDDTGKEGDQGQAENEQLKEFDEETCAVLEDTELTHLKYYHFSEDSSWTVMSGYMAFLARPDGAAPEWAVLDLA